MALAGGLPVMLTIILGALAYGITLTILGGIRRQGGGLPQLTV